MFVSFPYCFPSFAILFSSFDVYTNEVSLFFQVYSEISVEEFVLKPCCPHLRTFVLSEILEWEHQPGQPELEHFVHRI